MPKFRLKISSNRATLTIQTRFDDELKTYQILSQAENACDFDSANFLIIDEKAKTIIPYNSIPKAVFAVLKSNENIFFMSINADFFIDDKMNDINLLRLLSEIIPDENNHPLQPNLFYFINYIHRNTLLRDIAIKDIALARALGNIRIIEGDKYDAITAFLTNFMHSDNETLIKYFDYDEYLRDSSEDTLHEFQFKNRTYTREDCL